MTQHEVGLQPTEPHCMRNPTMHPSGFRGAGMNFALGECVVLPITGSIYYYLLSVRPAWQTQFQSLGDRNLYNRYKELASLRWEAKKRRNIVTDAV